MIAMIAAAAARRLFRIASTTTPAGTWLSSAVAVPMLSASPIWPSVQCSPVR